MFSLSKSFIYTMNHLQKKKKRGCESRLEPMPLVQNLVYFALATVLRVSRDVSYELYGVLRN
jgi:hypothetical protein